LFIKVIGLASRTCVPVVLQVKGLNSHVPIPSKTAGEHDTMQEARGPGFLTKAKSKLSEIVAVTTHLPASYCALPQHSALFKLSQLNVFGLSKLIKH
jgi:hypothetical protein